MIIVRVVEPSIGRTSPPTNWSDCSALTPTRHSLRCRPVGWTAHRMGFIVSYARGSPATLETPRCLDSSTQRSLRRDQLVELFIAWVSSSATPGTPRCSDTASYARDSSVLGHCQLRRGLLGARTPPATSGTPRCSDIASYVGDSSMLGFFVQASPAKILGSRSHRWSDLATSHRCAIKLLHAVRIRVLILGSRSGVLIHACQMMSASFQTSFL